MDFEVFHEWNPLIPSIQGSLKTGNKPHISIQVPGTSSMKFTPIIFILEPEEDRTRFRHEESFSGLLISLLPKSFFEKTKRGFEAMNSALKRREVNTLQPIHNPLKR